MLFLRGCIIFLVSYLAIVVPAHAVTKTYQNDDQRAWVLQSADAQNNGGSTPSCVDSSGNTSSCSTRLLNAGQQLVKIPQAGPYMVIGYEICADNQVKSNGSTDSCVTSSGERMWITVDYNSVYAVADGGTVTVTQDSSSVYRVVTTPGAVDDPDDPEDPPVDDDNCTLPEPAVYDDGMDRFINLSGLEWDYLTYVDYCDMSYYAKEGFSGVRLPVKWEYLQPDLSKAVDWNSGYPAYVKTLVTKFTSAGYRVDLDLHNYMKYNNQVIGGESTATAEDYAALWADIANQFKEDDLVIFGLMNEPIVYNSSGYQSTELVLSNQNKAIAAIRNIGAENLILVSANGWDNAKDFGKNYYGTPSNEVFTEESVQDPFDNWQLELHAYCNASDTPESGCSADCVSVDNFDVIADWQAENDVAIFYGEAGATTSDACISAIHNLIPYLMQQNTSTISLWAGPKFDPNSYPLYLGDNTRQMDEGYCAVDGFLQCQE